MPVIARDCRNLEATFQPRVAGPLCLGMAGNEDEDTGVWDPEVWAGGLIAELKGAVEKTVRKLVIRCDEDCDTAEADRRVRAVHNAMRAIQTIVATVRAFRSANAHHEDAMRDKDDGEDLCPEAVERAREELRSRLGHLRSVVERKCLAAGLERPDPDGGFALDPEIA